VAATYYAAIDDTDPLTGAVYGVGLSPSAAILDARDDARDDEATYRVVPCSTAAYIHVTQHGGAPHPGLSVSVRGVALVSEEE
jgi:hypothetical protein